MTAGFDWGKAVSNLRALVEQSADDTLTQCAAMDGSAQLAADIEAALQRTIDADLPSTSALILFASAIGFYVGRSRSGAYSEQADKAMETILTLLTKIMTWAAYDAMKGKETCRSKTH